MWKYEGNAIKLNTSCTISSKLYLKYNQSSVTQCCVDHQGIRVDRQLSETVTIFIEDHSATIQKWNFIFYVQHNILVRWIQIRHHLLLTPCSCAAGSFNLLNVSNRRHFPHSPKSLRFEELLLVAVISEVGLDDYPIGIVRYKVHGSQIY